MKKIKILAAATVLSALSFGAFAAQPSYNTASQTTYPSATFNAADIEAGSNIQPGLQNTGRSTDDAFDVHTLVAGEWY